MAKAVLREEVYTSDVTAKIDRENKRIREVKIIGKLSKNGYAYSDKALKEATEMYEQISVNVDHPDRKNPLQERSVMDKVGWFENTRWKPDGIYGDFQYLESHPASALILEWAERNPKGIGFSHNADGEMRTDGSGGKYVESITKVRSVDLVGCPATTAGLYESHDSQEEEPIMVKTTIRKLIESRGSSALKGHVALFENLPDEATAVIDAEVEVEEVEDGVDAMIKSAFDHHILNAANSNGNVDPVLVAKRAAIEGKVPEVEEPETPETPEGPSLESVQEELRQMKLRDEVRSLMEEHRVKATDARIKALCGVAKADRMELIEDWKQAGRPGRSAPLYESENVGSFEEEKKKFDAEFK